MKITKSQLRKIIKEEVSKVLLEEYTEEASLHDERHFLTLDRDMQEPRVSFYDTFIKAIDPKLDGTPEQEKLLHKAYAIADAEQPSEVDEFDRLLKKVKLPAGIVDKFKIKPKDSSALRKPRSFYPKYGGAEQKRQDDLLRK